jgi:hypothetical protein
VRLGTSEFYAVIDEDEEITDSLVVHLEDANGGPGQLLLFIVTRDRPAPPARRRRGSVRCRVTSCRRGISPT